MTKNVPEHIAVIMDGNRRWAKEKGLPTLEGHRKGYGTVKKVAQWCLDRNIKILTVFAFSTENWNRSKKEVNYLMNLLKCGLRNDVNVFDKKNIRLNVLGRIEGLPKGLQKEIKRAVAKTKNNTKAVLNLAINYGGRAEIVDTVKQIIDKKIPAKDITESIIAQNLYTKDILDPDLIIRTSGEMRASGFLPWQGAYSELHFCKTYWPDFSEADFDEALNEFNKRQRRFGK